MEGGGCAVAWLGRGGLGVVFPKKEKQRHEVSYHTIDRFASDWNGGCGLRLGRRFGQLSSVLSDGRDRGARNHDGTGRRAGLRGSPCPQRWPARSSLGPKPGQDRLPRWQGGG